MRIIAGEWRGRQIKGPPGEQTRPTADRTRETLFSMLTSRLGSFEDLLVADLFAGSGALGLEALSRGASKAIFVEQDGGALRVLRENVAALGAQQRCDVRATSVLALGRAETVPDLILLDPPYETGAGAVALDKLRRLGWIGPATWVALETSHREEAEVKGMEIETVRKVGKAKLHLLRLAET